MRRIPSNRNPRVAAALAATLLVALTAAAGCGRRDDAASTPPSGGTHASAPKSSAGLHAMEAHPAPSGADGLPP